MKKFFTILAVLISAALSAQTMDIKYGPWVTNVTEDSFTVLWVTPCKALSWVEVSPDNGSTWYQNNHDSYFETVAGRKMYGTFHSVKVTGLKPATKYQYRVVGKAVTDDSNPYALAYGAEKAFSRYKVKTLDYKAPVCRFSMVNDMHFDVDKYAALMDGMDKEKTDFIVLNGDIISFSNARDTLIKYTFEPIEKYAASYPVIFARGNHEGRGAEWYLTGDVFPTNTGEFYYTFRQGPVAFIVLDAGEDKPDNDPEYSGQGAYDEYRAQELEWLKKVVKTPEIANAPQKVVLMHIPTFDGPDAWYSQHWIAQNFTPILNEAGVKLMLCGHHHKYIIANPGEYGNDYTIIANSNNERLDFEASSSSITVRTFDVNGNQTRTLSF